MSRVVSGCSGWGSFSAAALLAAVLLSVPPATASGGGFLGGQSHESGEREHCNKNKDGSPEVASSPPPASSPSPGGCGANNGGVPCGFVPEGPPQGQGAGGVPTDAQGNPLGNLSASVSAVQADAQGVTAPVSDVVAAVPVVPAVPLGGTDVTVAGTALVGTVVGTVTDATGVSQNAVSATGVQDRQSGSVRAGFAQYQTQYQSQLGQTGPKLSAVEQLRNKIADREQKRQERLGSFSGQR